MPPSEPEPETEVISCPACDHLLRVPLGWLGEPVQCPECRAKFRAPTRDAEGALTAPVLTTRPPPPPGSLTRKADPMLMLPAFGLMFCGIVGAVVNGVSVYQLKADPERVKTAMWDQLFQLRQSGFAEDEHAPREEQIRRDEERAGRLTRFMGWVWPTAAGISVVEFLGGLAITLGRFRRLGEVACVLAAVNLPNFCCVPGAIAGVWGLLMLSSEEGRAHFLR